MLHPAPPSVSDINKTNDITVSLHSLSLAQLFHIFFFCNVLSVSVPSSLTPSPSCPTSRPPLSLSRPLDGCLSLVIVLEMRVLNMRVSSNAPFHTIACVSRGSTFNMTECGYAVVSADITSDNHSHFDVTVT